MSSLELEDLSSHRKFKGPFYSPPPKIEERIMKGHETTIYSLKINCLTHL